MPYIQQEAIKQIQALYAVLGYVTPPSLVGKNGEQSESWISIGEDGKEIFVQHKYWPEITVAAFRQIVEAVAPIHWWSVVREY